MRSILRKAIWPILVLPLVAWAENHIPENKEAFHPYLPSIEGAYSVTIKCPVKDDCNPTLVVTVDVINIMTKAKVRPDGTLEKKNTITFASSQNGNAYQTIDNVIVQADDPYHLTAYPSPEGGLARSLVTYIDLHIDPVTHTITGSLADRQSNQECDFEGHAKFVNSDLLQINVPVLDTPTQSLDPRIRQAEAIDGNYVGVMNGMDTEIKINALRKNGIMVGQVCTKLGRVDMRDYEYYRSRSGRTLMRHKGRQWNGDGKPKAKCYNLIPLMAIDFDPLTGLFRLLYETPKGFPGEIAFSREDGSPDYIGYMMAAQSSGYAVFTKESKATSLKIDPGLYDDVPTVAELPDKHFKKKPRR